MAAPHEHDAADAGVAGSLGAAGERAREGIDHLQAAARELIQAARALLDVAEELVNDPETVTTVVGTLGSFANAAARVVPTSRANGDEPDDERVERIRVR